MNLKPFVRELILEKTGLHDKVVGLQAKIKEIDALLASVTTFQAGNPLVPLVADKKALVTVPAFKARKFYHRITLKCQNPTCGKNFRAVKKNTKFHSEACRHQFWAAEYKARKQKLEGAQGKAEEDNSHSAEVLESRLKTNGEKRKYPAHFKLFCQNPACGKAFEAAKPWARWCSDCWSNRGHLSKLYRVPKERMFTMTAGKPPAQPNKAAVLLPGDQLRAGH